MFREMRRKKQSLSEDLCLDILRRSTHGVMALLGDEGYPYALPLNHVLADGKLYFHCAPEGHKLDALQNCEQVSYCVIDADEVDPQALSTRFRSVIAFGRAHLVTDDHLKRRALTAIGERFAPQNMRKALLEIDESLHRTGVIEFNIEHLSGKESGALAREREQLK